jgi:sec-independent protein translocase protein TatA
VVEAGGIVLPMPLSWWELLLILLVLLLVFGAKRLPEMGRSMGKGMREFKDAVTGLDDKPSTSSTAPSQPAGLPSASSEPAIPQHDTEADEKERETVS